MNESMPFGTPTDGSHAGYHLTLEPCTKRVRVEYGGECIVDSDRVLVMHETRLAPVYYFPRDDVRMDLMEKTTHRTHCPFKGNASYWTLKAGGKAAKNVAWGYEEPYEEAGGVRDYIAFFWDAMDAWFEDGAAAQQPTTSDKQDDDNPFVDWLVGIAWKASSSEALVESLVQCLIEAGMPVSRLRIFIRTLHPQLFAMTYSWHDDTDEVTVWRASHAMVLSEQYQESPFAAIINGEGGVRRRLEGSDPKLDYPVLEDLEAEGATDYVAMPMRFSDGQINIISMSSKAPGGFTVGDLGRLYEILPLLSRLLEVQALKMTASTLLGTYLGKNTGQRVLDGLIKRGDGETIHALIWFSDLRNSTPMSETLSSDAYLTTLNEFFDCMVGSIVENGGEVLKFIGDAVLAIFPIVEPDSAGPEACGQALAAVRGARGRIQELNQQRSDRDLPAIESGVGLHRGDVTYGNIGSTDRLDFTVIGAPANETARIQDLCKILGTPVLISARLAERFTGELVSLGRHALRGVDTEFELWTLPELAEPA